MKGTEQDWKLRLKYGRLITPYKHFTIIADGEVDELAEGFEWPKGKAFMGMKIWAESTDQSADVYQNVGEQIGFNITGQLKFMSPNQSSHWAKTHLRMISYLLPILSNY